MKKTLSLILALAMCLSLCACGGADTPSTNEVNNNNSSNAEKAIIGAWNMGEYDVFVFSEDGKVARGEAQYDWWYDKETERYFLSVNGITLSFVIDGFFISFLHEKANALLRADGECVKTKKR